MDINQALAVIDSVTMELRLEGFVETMEYISEHEDEALPEVRVAYRTVRAGLARIFAAEAA